MSDDRSTDGVSRRDMLRMGCLGTVGSFGIGAAATARSTDIQESLEVELVQDSHSVAWAGDSPPFSSSRGMEMVPVDAETFQFGGDADRSVRVRNTDNGKSATFTPDSDSETISVSALFAWPFDFPLDDRGDRIGGEYPDRSENAEVEGTWSGDQNVATEATFSNYVWELLDESGNVVASTNELLVCNDYEWQVERDGETVKIPRDAEVDPEWTVRFFNSNTSVYDGDGVPVENRAGAEYFTIDIEEFAAGPDNSEWSIYIWQDEWGEDVEDLVEIAYPSSFFEDYDVATAEIYPESLDISTGPVETGDEPTIGVNIANADSATLTASYEDGSGSVVEVEREMTTDADTSGDEAVHWETQSPLPAIDTPGTWVDLSFAAETDDGGRTTVDTFEGDRRQENDDIGYHVFENVMSVLVLEGRFAESSELSERELEDVLAWEKARRDDINHYFGSSKGAMGAIGFDFTFERAGDDLYELPKERDKYGGLDSPWGNIKEVLDNLEREAADVDVNDYDFWIGTHRAHSVDPGKEGLYRPNGSTYVPYLTGPPDVDPEGWGLYVWLHEIGHAYGLYHTYALGLEDELCMMGDRRTESDMERLGEPALSTNMRLVSELDLQTGSNYPKSDHLGDMLTPEEVSFSETSDGYQRTIPALNSMEYGDEAPIIRYNRVGQSDVVYVMESRTHVGEDRSDQQLGRDWYGPAAEDPDPHGAAVIYRRNQPARRVNYRFTPNFRVSNAGLNLLTERDGDQRKTILLNDGETMRDKPDNINPVKVDFELTGKTGGVASLPEQFETEITAEQTGGIGEVVTHTMETVNNTIEDGGQWLRNRAEDANEAKDGFVEGVQDKKDEVVDEGKEWANDPVGKTGEVTGLWHTEESFTVPALHLVAEDAEGNRVGPTEDGSYEVGIPGASASGARVGDQEWITVPADADVEFSVDSGAVEQHIQDLVEAGVASDDPGEEQLSTGDLREELTGNYDISKTRYGENPEVVTQNGGPWVTDTSVRVQRDSIEPGTQADAEPSNAKGALDLVEITQDAALSEEQVTFENRSDDDLAVGGWTVTAADDDSYTFPDGTSIAGGETLTLYSRSGSDSDGELFWGADEAVWNAEGGTLEVTDGDGETRLDIGYDANGVIYYDPAEVAAGSGGGLPMTLVGLGAVSAGMLYLAARLRSGDAE